MLTKRCRRRTTELAQYRSWRSRDGRYSLIEVKSLLDDHRAVLVVETLPSGGQVILSRHRKRKPAERVIERLARS